jgi:hypothetical protein
VDEVEEEQDAGEVKEADHDEPGATSLDLYPLVRMPVFW